MHARTEFIMFKSHARECTDIDPLKIESQIHMQARRVRQARARMALTPLALVHEHPRLADTGEEKILMSSCKLHRKSVSVRKYAARSTCAHADTNEKRSSAKSTCSVTAA